MEKILRSNVGAVTGRARWSVALALSGLFHIVLLISLCWGPSPILVKPRWLAKGQGGSATPESVVLYLPQDLPVAGPLPHSLLSLPVKLHQARSQQANLLRRSNLLDRDRPPDDREAGSTIGSSFDGAADGDEIKQGFAVVFAPPHIASWELPRGVEGDVVVELTIDTEGNVIGEKLLLGLGSAVDDKVIAALRDWHFRPATRNGVAIPFKYDARFHFPS